MLKGTTQKKTSTLIRNRKKSHKNVNLRTEIFGLAKNIENYDTYVFFICSESTKTLKRIETLLNISIPDNIKEDCHKKKSNFNNFIIDKKNIIIAGYEDHNSCKSRNVYDVAGDLGMKFNNTKKRYLVFLNQLNNINTIISGIMQGFYNFTKYNRIKDEIPTIDFYSYDESSSSSSSSSSSKGQNLIKESIVINMNQHDVRNLVNEPVNKLDSITYLAHITESLSKHKKIKITVMDESKLKKMGMNLILAVNKGSIKPAMLVVIEYMGGSSSSSDNICLVGKGVMFDTGGLNIKVDKFYDMKEDMAGSAIVYGVIKTLAELNVRKNVIGILPLVQNDVGSTATHPGDIIKSYSGKTVEILDTDAEGRLILAEGISYCKKYNPHMIIDVATLTGQVEEIFNGMATGVLGNNQQLIEELKKCGEMENEKFWGLPIWDENLEDTQSTIADLKNINDGDDSTINGAAFIMNFLPKKNIKWMHMDIGGVSFNLEDEETRYIGATGESFRSLVRFIRNYDSKM
jgi:leucyl aminopeptidase